MSALRGYASAAWSALKTPMGMSVAGGALAGGIYGGMASDSSVLGGAILGAKLGALGKVGLGKRPGLARSLSRTAFVGGVAGELYSGDGGWGMAAAVAGHGLARYARAGLRGGIGRMNSAIRIDSGAAKLGSRFRNFRQGAGQSLARRARADAAMARGHIARTQTRAANGFSTLGL